MFQTQQSHHQQAPPPSGTQRDAAEADMNMNGNVNVSTSGHHTMGSLGSMGSMDGILEDLIMSDTVVPLASSDDIVNFSSYDNAADETMMDMADEAPMTVNYQATHPGASRSLARVVSKDSKGEQSPIQNVSPFQRAAVPAAAAVPQQQQQQQQHPEDFNFDKFFANYDLPPHLQPPTPVHAAPHGPPKRKRSHRRAHTMGSYDIFETVAAPAQQEQQPLWATPTPPTVHVVSAAAAPAPEMAPPLSMGDPLDHPRAAPVAAPAAAAAPPPTADPIMAFLTSSNAAPGASTMDDSADPMRSTNCIKSQKLNRRHRRIRSEGNAAFGNQNNFFTDAGITNVMMELASATSVPKNIAFAADSATTTTTTGFSKSPSNVSLMGSSLLEAVPEKKVMVTEEVPDLNGSHNQQQQQLLAEADPSQFMNHGTEAAWLENLQSSPVAGA